MVSTLGLFQPLLVRADPQSEQISAEWISSTIKHIKSKQNFDGGFYYAGGAIEPNLFSTYYNLEIINLLGLQIDNIDLHIQYLETLTPDIISSKDIREIYYYFLSMRRINPAYSDNRIEVVINQFKQTDGSFIKKNNNNQSMTDGLYATSLALELCNLMGIHNTDEQTTYEWTCQAIDELLRSNLDPDKLLTPCYYFLKSIKLMSEYVVPEQLNNRIYTIFDYYRTNLSENDGYLYHNLNHLIFISKFFEEPISLPKLLESRITESQNFDGCFGYSLDVESSDIHGTYEAIVLVTELSIDIKYMDRLINTLASLECTNGGFDSIDHHLSWIDQAFYSFKVLEQFNDRPDDDTNFKSYLQSNLNSICSYHERNHYDYRDLFFIISTCIGAGVSFNQQSIIDMLYKDLNQKNFTIVNEENLQYIYYIVGVFNAMNVAKKLPNQGIINGFLYQYLNDDFGFGYQEGYSRLDVTRMCVAGLSYICRTENKQYRLNGTIGWVKNQCNRDGSYGIIHSSGYYTYLAIEIFNDMLFPKDSIEIQSDFIYKNLINDYGFQDPAFDVPGNRVLNTYYALELLDFISNEKSSESKLDITIIGFLSLICITIVLTIMLAKHFRNGEGRKNRRIDKQEVEWVKCPRCKTRLKSKNIERHMLKVHKLK